MPDEQVVSRQRYALYYIFSGTFSDRILLLFCLITKDEWLIDSESKTVS